MSEAPLTKEEWAACMLAQVIRKLQSGIEQDEPIRVAHAYALRHLNDDYFQALLGNGWEEEFDEIYNEHCERREEKVSIMLHFKRGGFWY